MGKLAVSLIVAQPLCSQGAVAGASRRTEQLDFLLVAATPDGILKLSKRCTVEKSTVCTTRLWMRPRAVSMNPAMVNVRCRSRHPAPSGVAIVLQGAHHLGLGRLPNKRISGDAAGDDRRSRVAIDEQRRRRLELHGAGIRCALDHRHRDFVRRAIAQNACNGVRSTR